MQAPFENPAPPPLRRFVLVLIASAWVVVTLYVWIVSRGTWTQWPTRTDYYDQQATSFARGQLALQLKPDPALLALSDPYAPAARANIPFPLDVSLYQGKFFLYFGPVPALLLMPLKLLIPGRIGDQYLVFLFTVGIFIFLSLIILKLWRRSFSDTAPWMMWVCILLAGLAAPFDAVLNGSAIYDVAVTGGQFFFLAGLYTGLGVLDENSISKWKLAITGLLWSAALGCRITLILPIAFMTLMVVLVLLRNIARSPRLSWLILSLLSIGLPLALGLAMLGWYNWARFGSVFETGISYQLAGPNLEKHRQDIFSSDYIIQNLYNYVFNAPASQSGFPYLSFAPGKVKPVRSFVSFPRIYDAERMAGILYATPFVLFAIVPAIAAFRKPRRDSFARGDVFPIKWITVALYGSFLLGFVFFLVFFWAAERYLIDFLPPLLLLSVIGFWQLARWLDRKPVVRFLYPICFVGLAAISMIVSTLLALGKTPLR